MALLPCLLLAVSGCLAEAPGPWRTLPGGLQVGRLRAVASEELPVDLWLVRLDPARHELRAVIAPARPDGSPTPRMAGPLAEEIGALALVNASYFDEAGRPLGLLLSAGRTLQQPNRKGWGWLAVAGGRLNVRDARAAVPDSATEGVQAGPLLVSAGRPRVLGSPRRARRSFAGSDASGRIVLGATTGSLTLQELARLLAKPEVEGGAGLVEALNLDGGSSAQLHVAGEDPALKVAGVPVPVFLGAFAKPGSTPSGP